MAQGSRDVLVVRLANALQTSGKGVASDPGRRLLYRRRTSDFKGRGLNYYGSTAALGGKRFFSADKTCINHAIVFTATGAETNRRR